ncbi:hypothetical protein A6D6_01626 [Alcanivorax xiamenensis]|uniref:Metallo-beta-lactamase domain-containing protein n=1 Tax=Alcanivorax xiamenensis TaxID=1177156 RepID=A0ABQ6Y9A5_9GAMM|nr:MBL fold metallo-hydrolase [Alcanivorax xiamenensis]KAF0806291.1 hypothetical protein A6D6_01626 [Alcanivorax xiamenensis]
MSIRIHHLNCGTMCPLCDRLMNNQDGQIFKKGKLVCHCLLIEAPGGLILVDTGLGTHDIDQPRKRLGLAYPPIFQPRLDYQETALHQIQQLGFRASDVRHIALTHVDLDHAGGLSDFPQAQVHIFKPELEQLLNPGFRKKNRFRPIQFDHQPDWVVHEEQGENWFGFSSIRAIPGLSPDILLIPLVGHTRGHTGVAVKQGERWLLHCGDAYYHHSQVTENPRVPFGSMMFQKGIASLPSERVRNLQRLRELALSHADEVSLFSSHDPVEFDRYAAPSR